MFAFVSPLAYLALVGLFNRWFMLLSSWTSWRCIEHERLALELLEVRKRGQYLTRLRPLNRVEREDWDRRERSALSRLVDQELEHGCRD
jgi:hypothetical protein